MAKIRARRGWLVESPGGAVERVPGLWSSIASATTRAHSPDCDWHRSSHPASVPRSSWINRWFRRADAAERRWCLKLNRSGASPGARRFFGAVSRLGDGLFWYALLAILPLAFGRPGFRVSVQLGATALVGVLVYLVLKTRLVRERPYITHLGVEAHVLPLDRYSFPSGHALHAVCFTLLTVPHFPWLALVLVPFTALVAASRVMLGLHYPSDVLVGGAIGALLAGAAYSIAPV